MSSRADDLTADLLHDLSAEQSAPTAPAAPAPQRDDAAAFVDTDLFLAPHSWRRPGLVRDGGALTFRAGPLQVRIGRRR